MMTKSGCVENGSAENQEVEGEATLTNNQED